MNTDFTGIFSISTEEEFKRTALDIFRYQAAENQVYHDFIRALNINAAEVHEISAIPFLPIDLFKSHTILCGSDTKAETVFTSSGTTAQIQSRHAVMDISLYEQSFRKGFELFYGDIQQYAVLALLPSYLERDGSSLIYMVDNLIKDSKNPISGYFLYNHQDLYTTIQQLQNEHKKVILIGVTYALLDFIETYQIDFPELIVMETGGMKGKRKELIREELHQLLRDGFGVENIHSEYGMTELLSQAYSVGDGIFTCPPWMKLLIRDTNDPFSYLGNGRTGGINVIDLANLHSCSFIATQDLGKMHEDNSFEILGRFDNSDIRGCNLLIQ